MVGNIKNLSSRPAPALFDQTEEIYRLFKLNSYSDIVQPARNPSLSATSLSHVSVALSMCVFESWIIMKSTSCVCCARASGLHV